MTLENFPKEKEEKHHQLHVRLLFDGFLKESQEVQWHKPRSACLHLVCLSAEGGQQQDRKKNRNKDAQQKKKMLILRALRKRADLDTLL